MRYFNLPGKRFKADKEFWRWKPNCDSTAICKFDNRGITRQKHARQFLIEGIALTYNKDV